MIRLLPATLAGAALLVTGCNGGGGGGAKSHTVAAVVDGDTIEIEDGERVRLIGIDTPETSSPEECWGDEAYAHLASLIGSSKVRLEYDVEREDAFDRTLAYVYTVDDDVFVNAKMLEDGAACLLLIPPNGEQFETYFASLEEGAQTADRGLWGACGGCDTPASFAPRGGPAR